MTCDRKKHTPPSDEDGQASTPGPEDSGAAESTVVPFPLRRKQSDGPYDDWPPGAA